MRFTRTSFAQTIAMTDLTISANALATIRAAVKASQCREPAVTFRDAEDLELNAEDSAAVRAALSDSQPGAFDDELQSRLRERYRGGISEEGGYLDLVVVERAECRAADLWELEHVTFALPAAIRSVLHGYTLDRVNGRYVLNRGERTFLTLMSVLRSSPSTKSR